MSRRRSVVRPTVLLPQQERPAPTYPEYAQLLADARASVAADGGRVDPAKLRARQLLPRGYDWRVAVLGHDRTSTVVEMHMLLLAHERDLDPPLPQWVVDARAEADRAQDAREAARRHRETADQAAWDAIKASCPVAVEVRRSGHARARFGFWHHLGHVVPLVDVRSGVRRRHRAGRALCESENRTRELDLSGGTGGPATCVSCLTYTQKIRPAAV